MSDTERARRWSDLLYGFLKTGLLSLLVAMLTLYLGDLAGFMVKKHRGTAYGSIVVNQFLATPLKGQKEEFDVIGSADVTCSRTIFPQPGMSACWWLARHKNQWQ